LVNGGGGNMVGWTSNAVVQVPLEEAVASQKAIDPSLYELAEVMSM